MAQGSNKQSWFARHKVLSIMLGLILLIIIVSSLGGGSDSTTKSSSSSDGASKSSGAKVYKFADRADKQEKDVEVLPTETATVDGVKLTVSSVEYKTSMSEYETADTGKTFVVADVVLENTSDRTKPYNSFDFRMQTAGGQVLDSTYATTTTPLNSGDIVTGGKAQGQVVFEVPVEEAHQYIIWKPGFGSERAIVQAK